MCGRYNLTEPDELPDRYEVEVKEPIKPNYNVSPGQFMPIITEEDGRRKLEIMKWGFTRPFTPKLLFNTRADKALGGMWGKATTHRRCLIPANAFYEWQKREGGTQPFLIYPKEIRTFSFAGIWEPTKDKDGKAILAYSIITTEPNKEMNAIHNRMPVILHPDQEKSWLEAGEDPEAISDYLLPFEDNGLDMLEVSRDLNYLRNDQGVFARPENSK